ncbi:MAG: HmuY family protein [Saprospiraceae bacterium]
MNRLNLNLLFVLSIMGLGLASCTKDVDSTPDVTTHELVVSSSQTGEYSYFNFEQGTVVTENDMANSTSWDFGLKLVFFQVNGGTNRKGEGGVVIVDNTFDNVTTAPESGYKQDNGLDTAIKDEWYTYDPLTHSFTPKAGKVFIFKTAKGKYAKMEIVKGEPTDDNGNVVVPPVLPTKIKYTIRYAFQSNGSRDL